MKLSLVTGWILIVIASGSIGFSLVVGAKDTAKVRRYSGRIDRMDARYDSLRKELHATNLLARGHQESMKNIPDSTRMAQSGIIVKRSKEYNKRMGGLEAKTRDLKRKIKRDEHRRDTATSHLKRWGAPFGAGGVLILLVGLVMVRRGRV